MGSREAGPMAALLKGPPSVALFVGDCRLGEGLGDLVREFIPAPDLAGGFVGPAYMSMLGC
eukprot:scaffold2564_cov25-Tisochrysis_lutea.AAC.3